MHPEWLSNAYVVADEPGGRGVLIDAGAPPEEIASHLLVTPRRGEAWVVELLLEAARSSLQKGAADSAVSYFRRALEEPPSAAERPELLLQLGVTEEFVSDPACVVHLRQAYDELSDPRQRATAALVLARALLFTAPAGEATAVVRRAMADLPAELVDERQALEAADLIAAWFGGGEPDQFARLARYRERREGDGPGSKMLAAIAAYYWALTGGPADACAALALESLEGGALLDVDNVVLSVASTVTLVFADRDEALETWDTLMEHAHGRG